MNTGILQTRFGVNALLGHLRNGNLPSEHEAIAIDRLPWIYTLRQNVDGADRELISVLSRTVKTNSGAVGGLAVSLLHDLIKVPDVQQLFVSRWESADALMQNRIMWSMLGKSDIEPVWQGKFRDFVLNPATAGSFCDFNQSWYGVTQEGVARIVAKLIAEDVPITKKWVYLCAIPTVVSDRATALGLMEYHNNKLNYLLSAEEVRTSLALLNPPETIADSNPPNGFLSRSVIEALRAGTVPSVLDSDLLNTFPLIDELRQLVEPSDLEWLLPVVCKRDDAIAAFYLSLLRRLSASSNQINDTLRSLWQKATPYYKSHLFWRILDEKDLPLEWHEELFAFTVAEWDVFSEVSHKFLANTKSVVVDMLHRIGDETFPDSKKWAYLCRAVALDSEPEATRALLQLGRTMPNQFTQRVAVDLLQRFYLDVARKQ